MPIRKPSILKLSEFILQNAQLTTSGNYAVYGTITPEELEEVMSLHPKGDVIFEEAVASRVRGKKKA